MSISSMQTMTNFQPYGLLAKLAAAAWQWREHRRETALLARLDERDLHDLGLSNADRVRLMDMSPWHE